MYSWHECPDLRVDPIVLKLAQEVTCLQSIVGSDHNLESVIDDVVTQNVENGRRVNQVMVLGRVVK